VAGKARVHELAKELGVTSKEVLARLNEQGEFVKSASSTVEAPVARRLRESFGGSKPAPAKAPAKGPDKSLDKALDQAISPATGNGEATGTPAKAAGTDARASATAQASPGAAAEAPAAPAPAPGRPSAPSGQPQPGQPGGPTPGPTPGQPAARPDAEAGGPYPARRQQPVLLGTTRRPAHPASAGAPPRGCQAGRAAPGRFARQHATPPRRSRWTAPPRAVGRAPARRRPARWTRRPLRLRRR